MEEEIPAIAVIEGYRKLVAEQTEENIILKWQVAQQNARLQQLVDALEQMSTAPANGSVGSVVEVDHG